MRRYRYTTAWHESGHAVAAFVLGRPIERIALTPDPEMGERAGCVRITPFDFSDLGSAADMVTILLAGEATTRISWALKALDDAKIDPEEMVPATADDLLDEVPYVPNGASPVEHGAFYGFWDQRDQPDMAHAERVCDEFTHSQAEAVQMLRWLETRCVELVQSERFQTLANMTASILLDRGEIDGALITHLLQRRDALLKFDERKTSANEVEG